jgi:hypothetical protein
MTARRCLFPCVLVLLAGCGGSGPKPVPVSGRVTLDNKPLANATLQFVPAAGAQEGAPPLSSVGTTAEDGRYELILNNAAKTKGALAGKYKVIVTLGAQSGGDSRPTYHKQLPERYNRKSELECEIPAGGRDDANFDLTSR